MGRQKTKVGPDKTKSRGRQKQIELHKNKSGPTKTNRGRTKIKHLKMSYKQKQFWDMTNFTKVVITRPPDSNTQIPVRQLKRHKTRINVTLVVLGYLLETKTAHRLCNVNGIVPCRLHVMMARSACIQKCSDSSDSDMHSFVFRKPHLMISCSTSSSTTTSGQWTLHDTDV